MDICLQARIRRFILVCLALVTMFSVFLLTTLNVQANSVTINDQAGVLDAGRVQAEAAKLSTPMLIYTTKTFNGDQDALNRSTREQLPNQNAIAIGIDTVHRNLSIEAGTNVRLSDSQASDALSAFQNNYHGGDYTGATIAAIDSLQSALSGSGMTPLGVAVAILLCLVVVALIAFAVIRRRTGGSNGPPRGGGRRRMGVLNTPYPYYGAIPTTSAPPSGNYGGGAGGSFGGGSSGGGAGGHF
jgi:hypothetical protein